VHQRVGRRRGLNEQGPAHRRLPQLLRIETQQDPANLTLARAALDRVGLGSLEKVDVDLAIREQDPQFWPVRETLFVGIVGGVGDLERDGFLPDRQAAVSRSGIERRSRAAQASTTVRTAVATRRIGPPIRWLARL